MKKILILLIISFFSFQMCFAQEDSDENFEQYFSQDSDATQEIQGHVEYNDVEESEDAGSIYLNDDVLYKQVNFAAPKKINSDKLNLEAKKATFQPFGTEMKNASRFDTQEYAISPINTSYSGQIGKFTFGTKYNSGLSARAEVNYSTAIFTKYEGRYFALTTTFLKSTGSDYSSYNDRFQIAPEWKITKRLSLLDVMQTDMFQINKKNEIVLRYKPNFKKYADEVQFELGAGQSFYNDSFVKSSVTFSTNLKL